ncbi:MAG TPA: glycosyltransferase family 2 protein, partial [Candidatus Dormibacteraeota bacterium]|nr:glycosyltransferase family 2 protein [Candidatus Dormibacteraeota bacterium]
MLRRRSEVAAVSLRRFRARLVDCLGAIPPAVILRRHSRSRSCHAAVDAPAGLEAYARGGRLTVDVDPPQAVPAARYPTIRAGGPHRVVTSEPTPYTVAVLPAFQAERTLRQTVDAVPRGSVDHLLLVDDASGDGTVALAVAMGLDVRSHSRNAGYGANQKTCYREALALGATIVVLLHPDYQYDPAAIPELVAPLEEGQADMTFGSRFAGGADPRLGGMPGYRYLGNRVTTWAQNQVLGTSFTEMHSGMRAYTREVLEA